MARRLTDQGKLARTLASLPTLPLDDLKQSWRDLFATEPPILIGRTLLTRAIAHRLQEKALGGLKPTVARSLKRVAETLSDGQLPVAAPAALKPGTRLLRQWQGDTHEVIIAEDGVRYRGQVYRSLSEVARVITGARWSGPLFFGLKGQRHDPR